MITLDQKDNMVSLIESEDEDEAGIILLLHSVVGLLPP